MIRIPVPKTFGFRFPKVSDSGEFDSDSLGDPKVCSANLMIFWWIWQESESLGDPKYFVRRIWQESESLGNPKDFFGEFDDV